MFATEQTAIDDRCQHECAERPDMQLVIGEPARHLIAERYTHLSAQVRDEPAEGGVREFIANGGIRVAEHIGQLGDGVPL
jgi:hypothetical protein